MTGQTQRVARPARGEQLELIGSPKAYRGRDSVDEHNGRTGRIRVIRQTNEFVAVNLNIVLCGHYFLPGGQYQRRFSNHLVATGT